MAENSKIEWTDATWNTVSGCHQISPGCTNCYAKRLHARLGKMGQPKYQRPFSEIVPREDDLDKPLRWRKPRRVFVNSMSDLFHEQVPFEFIAAVFSTMHRARQHTFQVLTKRPERARTFFDGCANWEGWITHNGHPPSGYGGDGIIVGDDDRWPLPNVWLGTSVENQRYADERIPHLLACPAAVRFLSCEPLLGPVDLSAWLPQVGTMGFVSEPYAKATGAKVGDKVVIHPLGGAVDWVIVGGESGPGYRTMPNDLVESIAGQCRDAEIAFFLKQMAGKQPIPDRWPFNVREFPEVQHAEA